MLKRRKQQAEGISQILYSGLAILLGAYLGIHKISTFLAITQLEIVIRVVPQANQKLRPCRKNFLACIVIYSAPIT